MTDATLEQNLAEARQQHLVPGREIHMQDMRGYRFGEVALVTGSSPANAVANIWNTTGACDPTPDQFDALDAGAIALENGVLDAWLNPVRRSVFDQLDIAEAGDDKTFGDITGTWTEAVDATVLRETADLSRFDPGYSYSTSVLTYAGGSRVYVLDAPDGEVFVLQSFTTQVDPALSGDNLAHLGDRLDLPDGWGFRTETVGQDMAVRPNPENLAHLLTDNLNNLYVGSDAGRAFSELAPPDSLW